MAEGYVVYVEIEPEGPDFFSTGTFKSIFLSSSSENAQEAVERATDELPLRAYKRITSIRVVALDDMKELARW